MEPDSCWEPKTTAQGAAYLQHEDGQILEWGPRKVVGPPVMEILKDELDKAPGNLI